MARPEPRPRDAGTSRPTARPSWSRARRAAAVVAAALLLAAGLPPARPAAAARRARTRVEVDVSDRVLVLHGPEGPRRYTVSLGLRTAEGPKERRGDQRTPVGRYYIQGLQRHHRRLHRFALLSYPNPADARRGVTLGLITQDIAQHIAELTAAGRPVPQDTPLGGEVGIHGLGRYSDARDAIMATNSSNGCIMLPDPEIDEIWPALRVGTPVEIHP